MININDRISLIRAAEQIKPPATYLVDQFFPTVEQNPTETLMMEYRKRGREKLAPYIVEGGKGINVNREGSKFRVYSPPMVAPKRVITQRDVNRRGFGEMPYFSTMSVEERQAKLQADDLYDLISMVKNRKEAMAAELLTTGKITVEGYADDGLLTRIDEVQFEWLGDQVIMVDWDNANAKIFDNLQAMSERIQEEAGEIPSLMVVGKNVPKYLRKNKELLDWLMVPNRQNLAFASFEPRYLSPLVQYVGTISALGIEIVSYNATYTDDSGNLVPFVGPNEIILGCPRLGSVQHAAITLIDDGETGFQGYAAEYVPSYTVSKDANAMSLTLWSRFMLVPEVTGKWMHATVSAS